MLACPFYNFVIGGNFGVSQVAKHMFFHYDTVILATFHKPYVLVFKSFASYTLHFQEYLSNIRRFFLNSSILSSNQCFVCQKSLHILILITTSKRTHYAVTSKCIVRVVGFDVMTGLPLVCVAFHSKPMYVYSSLEPRSSEHNEADPGLGPSTFNMRVNFSMKTGKLN